MKHPLAIALVLLLGTFALAQDQSGTVIAIKANLRGTPTAAGIVVTTLDKGETFELIKDKTPWYLIQTSKYVGWIHGNAINLGDSDVMAKMKRDISETRTVPRTTTKETTSGASPFQREYRGGTTATLNIFNQTDRTLTLVFGGATYTVGAGSSRDMEVEGGRYEFSASVPRARPAGGVKEFDIGYGYSWRFYIVTH